MALGFGWLGAIHAGGSFPDGTPLAVRSLASERLTEVGRLAQVMSFAAQHPHPHVLPVSELRSDEQGVYYLMPQALGGSLRGVFERYRAAGAQVESGTMLDVARQVAEALDAAHARGVLHGNLKPENVLLQPLSAPNADEYRLLVSDFGLNSLRAPDPHSPYLPAPQRAGAAATLESDLYALGALMFEGLSSRALPPQPLAADLLELPELPGRIVARCLGLSAPFTDMTAFLGYLRAVQLAHQEGLGLVHLSADHSYLDAVPGEMQEVRLKVTSGSAQRVQLQLEGLPPDWTPKLPALDLKPGLDALVSLKLHLPRRSSVRTSVYETHLVALSQLGGGPTPETLELARLPLAVRVQPFEHSVLRLTALPSVARTATTITASLSNQGNQAQRYNLEVNLPAGSSVQRGSARRQLELAPGAEFSEILDVRLPTPGLSARPLTVTALANSATLPTDPSPSEDTGNWLPTYNTVKDHLTLEQRPLVPWWGLALLTLGLLGLGSWAARPPQIQAFQLQGEHPAQGAPFTLSWQTSGARQVQIAELPDQTLQTSGQVRLQGVSQPVTYTLVASGLFSQRQQQLTVTPSPPAPRITTFTVTPPQARLGQTVKVEWQVQNASNVQLSPFGAVPPSGSREFVVRRDTPLLLSARKGDTPSPQDVTSKLTVSLRPPLIQSFSVTPASAVKGQTVTLRWQVSGANRVRLAPLGELPASGSRSITASQDTTYTLKASNGQQEVAASAALSVRVPQASIDALTVTPGVLTVGQGVRVQWRSQNATRAWLRWGNQEQVVAPSGDVTLTVTPDMQSLTLVAENPNGEPAMLTRRLTVQAAPPSNTPTPTAVTPAEAIPTAAAQPPTPAPRKAPASGSVAATAPKSPAKPNSSAKSTAAAPKPTTSTAQTPKTPPAQVKSFTVQTSGDLTRLSWQVSGAPNVKISGLIGPNAGGTFPPSGSVTLPVSQQARTYVLSAGTARASVKAPPTKPLAASKTKPSYPGISGTWNHSFGQVTLNETNGRVTGSLLSSRADLPSGTLSGRLSGDTDTPTLNAYLQEGTQRVALIIRFDLKAQTFDGLYASRTTRVPWCGWKAGAANPCP